VPALAAEAARKSRICWLSYEYAGGAETERLVWHVWHDEAVVVLLGEPGQVLGGVDQLAPAGPVEHASVTVRSKDTGGRLLTWVGPVEIVAPGTARWEEHAAALLGVRLNLAAPAAALEEWRSERTILRVGGSGATVAGPSGPLP
jgi:hypothetical protein